MVAFSDSHGLILKGAGSPEPVTGQVQGAATTLYTDVEDSYVGTLSAREVWRTQPSVRKVVGFIARSVAALPWKVYVRADDNDRPRISDSPAEQLLRQPQPWVNGYELVRNLVIDKLLYDRFCAIWVPGGFGLHRIPPRLVVTRSDMGIDEPTEIQINLDGRLLDLSQNPEVAVAMGIGWSEFDAMGISPLVTLSQILQEQRRSVAWRSAQWERTPKFSGVLTRPIDAKWSNDSRARFKEDWKEFSAGKAGATPILEDGMTYAKIGDTISPKDALDIEGRRLSDVEVCSFFHIAPELVGARAGSYASVAAFREMLYGPGVGPIITELESAFNAHIVPAMDPRPGVYASLDREEAINGSFIEQADFLQTSTGGPWMTRNEARGRMDMPSMPGGDELITPLNVTAGGQASPTDSGSQNIKPGAPAHAPRPSEN